MLMLPIPFNTLPLTNSAKSLASSAIFISFDASVGGTDSVIDGVVVFAFDDNSWIDLMRPISLKTPLLNSVEWLTSADVMDDCGCRWCLCFLRAMPARVYPQVVNHRLQIWMWSWRIIVLALYSLQCFDIEKALRILHNSIIPGTGTTYVCCRGRLVWSDMSKEDFWSITIEIIIMRSWFKDSIEIMSIRNFVLLGRSRTHEDIFMLEWVIAAALHIGLHSIFEILAPDYVTTYQSFSGPQLKLHD